MSWSWNWKGWGNPKGWGKGWKWNETEEEESFYVPGMGRVKGRSLLDITSEDLPEDFYDDVPNYKIVNGHVVESED